MNIRRLFRYDLGRQHFSTAAARRPAQGPRLTRDLIPNKGPVLVIDFKEIAASKPEVNAEGVSKAEQHLRSELLKDFHQIASFNWYGSVAKPVMIIPGAPRYFRRSWAGGELKADDDERIVLNHLYFTPDYPLESLFVAVKKCAELQNLAYPNFSSYDVATDRVVLRRLLEFCRRRGSFPEGADGIVAASIGLRMDVERVGERLVLFSRREGSIYGVPPATNRHTFANDFRQSITDNAPLFSSPSSKRLLQVLAAESPSPAISSSSQYHIASYHFGCFKFLLRFTIPCVDIEKSRPATTPVDQQCGYTVDSIPNSNISCVYAGQRHHYYTIELTTRRKGRSFPRYKWSQLYFSQTDAVSVGWYDYRRSDSVGLVVPQLYSLEECRRLATTDNAHSFRDSGYDEKTLILLHRLLSRIIDFVRCQPDGKKFAVIWSARSSQLQVFEKSSGSSNALPDYLMNDIV